MFKIKLTKGELKKQRDALKQFKRYLPMLQLKKQQLQMKILEARYELKQRAGALESKMIDIKAWVGLLVDTSVDLKSWMMPKSIETQTANVAGANVTYFKDVIFAKAEYSYYSTPFWLDRGLEELRAFVKLRVEVDIIKKQIAILEKELRTTTQRVNLFEKVKIPECMHNMRIISIHLGDQQANTVGISKVAKKKVEARSLEFV